MNRTLITMLAACLIASVCAGCAAHRMDTKEGSGFLADYSQLKPGAEDQASKVYMKPGVDYKRYTKVMILPPVFYLKPDAEQKGIEPGQMKELSDYFRKSLVDALRGGYTIVDKPGPDVLILRTAITDVVPGNPVRGTLSSILPPGIVLSTGAKAATGEYGSVGQTEAEMEALDGQSGERLLAAVDRRAGTKAPFRGSLDDAKDAFDYWAQKIRARLDQLRGMK